MIITTTSTIEGKKVRDYLGIVSARVVLGANIFSDISSELRDIFGGRSNSVQSKLKYIEEQVLNELRREGKKIKADAILGLNLDFEELSGGGKNGMYMVVALGTAISFDKLENGHKTPLLNDYISNDRIKEYELIQMINKAENNELFNNEILDGLLYISDVKTVELYVKNLSKYITKYIENYNDPYSLEKIMDDDKLKNILINHMNENILKYLVECTFSNVNKYNTFNYMYNYLVDIIKNNNRVSISNLNYYIKDSNKYIFDIAKILVLNEFEYYTRDDFMTLKTLNEMVKGIPKNEIKNKKSILSSSSIWICTCGVENDHSKLNCSNCNKDVYGLQRNISTTEFIAKIDALCKILEKEFSITQYPISNI